MIVKNGVTYKAYYTKLKGFIVKKNIKILIFISVFSFTALAIFFSGKLTKNRESSPQSAKKICPLCSCGKTLHKNHVKLYGEEIEDTNILFNSENFYVAIDNYPVCEDHILIVPKEHKFSYSVLDKHLKYEFEAIIRTLSDIVGTKEYGLFEHGSNMVGIEQKGCGNSIYHAHMHFIPQLRMNQKDIIDLCTVGEKDLVITLKSGYELENCCTNRNPQQTILGYIKELPTKKPYLFCYYSNAKKEALCVPDEIIQGGVPSQFFRRVFAEHFQKNTEKTFWNWKNQDDVQKSIQFRKTITRKTIDKFTDKKKVKATFEKNLNVVKMA